MLSFLLQHVEYLLRVHFKIFVLILFVDAKLTLGASSYSKFVTGFNELFFSMLEVIRRLVLASRVKPLEAAGVGHLPGGRMPC